MSKPRAVIANSMWRTGSTYLARQFANSERYRLFYEPCHEYIPHSGGVGIGKAGETARLQDMNHPHFDNPLFENYGERDAQTGLRLRDMFDPAAAFGNAYDHASSETGEFLMAAARVAEAEGRTPFFGFCRSGFQHQGWDGMFEGPHLYLWRDPREQFRSYGWTDGNRYFVPATMAQLLLSRPLQPIVDRLASSWRSKPMRLLMQCVPASRTRLILGMGQIFSVQFGLKTIYALYYLSWLTSFRSNVASAEFSFRINDLAEDAVLREKIEHQYGISFSDLRQTSGGVVDEIGYAQIENEVEQLFDTLGPSFDTPVGTSPAG